MAASAELVPVLANFAHTLVRGYQMEEVLHQLTLAVTDVLGVDGAGVSLADTSGRLYCVAASDDVVSSMETMQVSLQEGACFDTYHGGEAVVAADLTAVPDGWERYAAASLQHGFHGAAGLPMRVDDLVIGALDLYNRAPLELTNHELEVAALLAAVASGYVVNARELGKAVQLADQLQTALDSRVVIEQAKGVIAERAGVGVTEAFEVLRRYARSRGQKLREVAAAVVAGELDPPAPSARRQRSSVGQA
jgi:transcriptional regulator with GAF, ATPase, and Fis domain